jgi:hypothetical protein
MTRPSFRDRIVELRRVRASELKEHPRNWRKHPRRQREALRAMLAEVGFADALIAASRTASWSSSTGTFVGAWMRIRWSQSLSWTSPRKRQRSYS